MLSPLPFSGRKEREIYGCGRKNIAQKIRGCGLAVRIMAGEKVAAESSRAPWEKGRCRRLPSSVVQGEETPGPKQRKKRRRAVRRAAEKWPLFVAHGEGVKGRTSRRSGKKGRRLATERGKMLFVLSARSRNLYGTQGLLIARLATKAPCCAIAPPLGPGKKKGGTSSTRLRGGKRKPHGRPFSSRGKGLFRCYEMRRKKKRRYNRAWATEGET